MLYRAEQVIVIIYDSDVQVMLDLYPRLAAFDCFVMHSIPNQQADAIVPANEDGE